MILDYATACIAALFARLATHFISIEQNTIISIDDINHSSYLLKLVRNYFHIIKEVLIKYKPVMLVNTSIQ